LTTIRCTHCGQTYELTPEQAPQYAGQTITCTTCKQPFTVEIPETINVAPPPPPPSFPVPGSPMPYAQGVSYATPAGPQQGNGLAVTSLVVGILGFCILPIVGGIGAIVLGILGLNKTKDPRVGGKGMAIAGIILGSLSMIMTPCMISILLPSLNRARETANRVKCASNMRQIGTALMIYGSANGGQYPPDLATLTANTPLTLNTLTCPSSNDTPAANAGQLGVPGHLSYVYVPGLTTSASADAILLYEPLTNHTRDGINILFGDGHVEFLQRAAAEPMIKAVEAGQNPPP